MIFKLARLEMTGLLLNDVFGKIEHIFCDFDILDVVKIFGLVAHFVGIPKQHPNEAFGPRLKRDDMLATGEYDTTQSDFVEGADSFADNGKGVVAYLAVG